jgi:cob(I)alamin adenosyltransferase
MSHYSITTKTGDDGKTSLLNSERVSKINPRPEAYGTLDEANAFLGLAKSMCGSTWISKILEMVQNHIYVINSELACPPQDLHTLTRRIHKRDLTDLETVENELEAELELPRAFVLYGQRTLSAYLDVARAVVRRAERRIVELYKSEPQENSLILAYINRLSDVLFLLARYDEFSNRVPYSHPTILEKE